MSQTRHVGVTWWLATIGVVALAALAGAYLLWQSSPQDLEQRLDDLPSHWSSTPQWRAPLAPLPAANAQAIYHVRLEPSDTRRPRDLRVLRDNRVAGYLDGFDAYDCMDFDDGCLKYVTSAKNLRGLVLEGTSVTDRGAEVIAKNFPNLLIVDLEGTKVTQAGVEAILKGHDLVMIDVSGLTIDKDSLTAFARTHAPNTVIKFSSEEFTDHPESAYDRLPFP